jgi:hypothetical protein
MSTAVNSLGNCKQQTIVYIHIMQYSVYASHNPNGGAKWDIMLISCV